MWRSNEHSGPAIRVVGFPLSPPRPRRVRRLRRRPDGRGPPQPGGGVALKLARPPAGAPALAREARHAALALSPRLPELLDLGQLADGRAFLALRWIAGAPLDPRAARAAAEALDLAMRVAAGAG